MELLHTELIRELSVSSRLSVRRTVFCFHPGRSPTRLHGIFQDERAAPVSRL